MWMKAADLMGSRTPQGAQYAVAFYIPSEPPTIPLILPGCFSDFQIFISGIAITPASVLSPSHMSSSTAGRLGCFYSTNICMTPMRKFTIELSRIQKHSDLLALVYRSLHFHLTSTRLTFVNLNRSICSRSFFPLRKSSPQLCLSLTELSFSRLAEL